MLGGSEFRLRQDFCLRQKCLYGANAPPRRAGPHPVMYLFRQHMTRRRGLHIVRDDFFTKVISHSFCRSSSPDRTRYAGLRLGFGNKPEAAASIVLGCSEKKDMTAGHVFLFGPAHLRRHVLKTRCKEPRRHIAGDVL